MHRESKYHVIGTMSGTSLDGLDIAHCIFRNTEDRWTFEITHNETISYAEELKVKLMEAMKLSAMDLARLDVKLGRMFGSEIRNFCEKNNLCPDLVSSHGHTIFHDPGSGLTTQIGCPAHISVISGYPCVADFRSVDVALGGQGAPLVPFGEKELFPEYDIFINIGGIANISHHDSGGIRAWDICPANMILNELASRNGKPFDENGEIAAAGIVNENLLSKLESRAFYGYDAPKSIGREWYEQEIRPLFEGNHLSTEDYMATACEHIAMRIGHDIGNTNHAVLLSGGGALNSHLVSRIRLHTCSNVLVPAHNTIAFKEALIFAFLGLKRYLNEINTLSSVTGAKRDSCGGCIYRP